MFLCLRFVQTLVGDGHNLLQYVTNISAVFMSVFCALEGRVIGPVLRRWLNRVERMHSGVATQAETPAAGGPVARKRLLLQHLQRRTVATTAARLCSQTHNTA